MGAMTRALFLTPAKMARYYQNSVLWAVHFTCPGLPPWSKLYDGSRPAAAIIHAFARGSTALQPAFVSIMPRWLMNSSGQPRCSSEMFCSWEPLGSAASA